MKKLYRVRDKRDTKSSGYSLVQANTPAGAVNAAYRHAMEIRESLSPILQLRMFRHNIRILKSESVPDHMEVTETTVQIEARECAESNRKRQ